jgi:FAD binding domain
LREYGGEIQGEGMKYESSPLQSTVLAALRKQLRGPTLLPGDPHYSVGRRVWNASIDRHPGAIVVCADAEDVALAVRIAADHASPLTVRAGGHNVAGRAVADGAIMLDLSGMRNVVVNGAASSATVQGGALWHHVDVATAAQGLATTGGLISGTGVGGFTLGGGAGWLMRKHGLACDNLLSAGVVLADGRFVRASALFWGLRGGAGRLGVVTSFEFQVHPMRQVLAGVVVRPAAEAGRVLRSFRDFAAQAPDEFCGMIVIAHAPSLPFLDASWHGRPVVISAMCWCGSPAAGEQVLAPLRQFGTPLADHVGPIPYLQWQHLQDPAAPAGRYQYWKTANFDTLTDATLDILAGAGGALPTPNSEIHVQHMGGAVGRVPPADTAFANRHAQFFVNLIGAAAWQDELGSMRERIRDLYAEIAPQSLPGMLPNFSNQDDGDVPGQLGASQGARLAALRRRYDAAGLFAGTD